MTKLDLAAIDNQLLDGLEFCTRVYDLFDRARKQPDGIASLRLRPSNIEKRLIEELIPIARYLQARYHEGRRIKVRWLSGSQPYDAVLWSSGELVKRNIAARKLLVEATTSVHQNNYLARQLLHEGGPVFGVEGNQARQKDQEDCINALRQELGNSGRSNAFVFKNRAGGQLTRFGVRYLLRKYLPDYLSPARRRKIHPHSLRHTTAIHLLKSGVDFATISQFLGHSGLQTTMRYARADLDLKRQALAQVFPDVLGAPKAGTMALHGTELTRWLRRL
jgi:hypothetical protein